MSREMTETQLLSRKLTRQFGKNLYTLPIFTGEVTGRKIKKLWRDIVKQCAKNPYQRFVLFITTDGGDADPARLFYSLVRTADINLITVALEHVYSAGLVLLLAGKQRFATAHTEFVIHQASLYLQGSHAYNEAELLEELQSLQHTNRVLLDILTENLSICRSDIDAMAKTETYLTAKDAKKIKLVQKII